MNKVFSLLSAVILLLSVSSCIKEKYDAPPTGGQDPDIAVNFSIDSLIKRFNGAPFQINEDLVIKALVVADDKAGNFYKTIIIQDSTAGIALRLDGTSLYTDYPVGRRVFIKLKGLWVGSYSNLLQIGGYVNTDGSLEEIPSAIFDKHVLKGVWGLPVIPEPVSISQLNANYANKLIELNDVEFTTADAGKPYADGYNKVSLNRTVKNCTGQNVIVRTSGYAQFANSKTPTGKGKLVAVCSIFNSTIQLLVRDLNDVKMDSVRCDGGVPADTNGISGVRSLYQGSDVTLPIGKTISGVVISDRANLNTDPRNMVIQDSTGGIVVRFTANHSFDLGDVVTVNVGGQVLTTFNSLVQVNNVTLSVATKTGTGSITPRVATVAQVISNAAAWESTLVKIQNATISGGSTWSGTRTITDGTGNLTHFTRSQATFSGQTMPTGTVSFTGILSTFNSPQLIIRNLSDVQ